MVKSVITGKEYDPSRAIYITSPVQAQKYLARLGTEFFLDMLYTGTKRPDSLVFVFERCPETRDAKALWDKHEL
ncbi:MAG: hypothetical protein LUB59_03780 [Candidatus Gastranaerophilales bacterium]|nr:hypothetical protein [Candidatus Gastranaerophilales bacterium]